MTTTAAATACAQLVYTSASRTLEGAGFGVVLVSRGWPSALGSARSSLGPLVGFEQPCLGLLHRGGGRVAYSKQPAPADGFGRPGNYVVQLLWDDAGRLGPRDVLAFAAAGGFRSSLADGAEPTSDAPAVAVPRARRAVPPLSHDDLGELVPGLADLLAAVRSGSGVVALPERTESGCHAAAVVFAVLPRPLTAGVSLHVGAARRMGDTAAVSVVVGDAGRSDVRVTPRDLDRARALLHRAAAHDLCPDSVRRLTELDRWLFVDAWLAADPASLDETQLVAVLGSDGAGRWLLPAENVEVAAAVAAEVPEVEAALRAALTRFPDAADRLRDRELAAALDAVFGGADEVPAGYTGLTEGELCEAFGAELARGRRVAAVGPATALFVEESLGLGVPVPLLGLGDDHAGLARLATRRPVVRTALVREWDACGGAASVCTSVLGHLLLEDTDWVVTLGASSPEPVVRPALEWAAERLAPEQVEELAVTVASGDLAGQGWALRDVLFACKLPDAEVAEMIARNADLLLRDGGWPRGLAKLLDARLAAGETPAPPETGTGRHRRPGVWPRRRRPD